jgi:hypothetical protein
MRAEKLHLNSARVRRSIRLCLDVLVLLEFGFAESKGTVEKPGNEDGKKYCNRYEQTTMFASAQEGSGPGHGPVVVRSFNLRPAPERCEPCELFANSSATLDGQ